jgi:deazaflavin-dependent oxidoreductase (nitroreductase family)
MGRTAMRAQWRAHRLLWKLSGGRLGRRVAGMPVLELLTTGHQSGRPRSILITYVEQDGQPIVVGTNAGAQYDPAWAKNLRADPNCRVRRAGGCRDATAAFLDGPERERAWDAFVAASPAYAGYRTSAGRSIPVVSLRER